MHWLEFTSVKSCCERNVVIAETCPPPSGTVLAAVSRALHEGCMRIEKLPTSPVNGANTERCEKLDAESGPVCRFCGYQTASPFTLYVPFGMYSDTKRRGSVVACGERLLGEELLEHRQQEDRPGAGDEVTAMDCPAHGASPVCMRNCRLWTIMLHRLREGAGGRHARRADGLHDALVVRST